MTTPAPKVTKPPRILVVAGSDSGGGAGIQGDIKTITVLGGYAMTAITALTAQDTLQVADVIAVPASFVALQMQMALTDIGADAIKTGMLENAEIVEAVTAVLDRHGAEIPLIVDPVMLSTSGRPLLDTEGVNALRRLLLPRATLFTPNVPEAEALLGSVIDTVAKMAEAAAALREFGPRYVLVKGGHLPGDSVTDILAGPSGLDRFEGPRFASRHTHGTGCTLASAAATFIGGGAEVSEAIGKARHFLAEALRTAPGFGAGHGPLNHAEAGRICDGKR